MRETRLSPGWLAAELAEAPSDAAMFFAFGLSPSFKRLDAADAARLRAKMAARYYDWTGRDLATDLALAEQEKGLNTLPAEDGEDFQRSTLFQLTLHGAADANPPRPATVCSTAVRYSPQHWCRRGPYDHN